MTSFYSRADLALLIVADLVIAHLDSRVDLLQLLVLQIFQSNGHVDHNSQEWDDGKWGR